MNEWQLEPDGLDEQGIHTVVVATPDFTGSLVGRRVPSSRFPQVIDDGVNISTCVFAWDLNQGNELIASDALEFSGLHNGLPDMTLRPDLATLRRAAWLDGIAICLADPVDSMTGEPLPLSPRVLLQRELAEYRERGMVPQTGTELEFYLFHVDGGEHATPSRRILRPTTPVAADFRVEEGNALEPFFRQLRQDLADSGIAVEAAQSELGTGQWELTFVYGDPLSMADQHALYKLAVRDAARAAGMSATFMAKPLPDQPGSSCHVHLSLTSASEKALFWDDGPGDKMSPLMRSAVAGLLHHAPEFMALYAPTINSWRRSRGHAAAGYGRTWGWDNRTVTVRILGSRPADRRLEFRLPGADTNPYLTLAAILASARDGMDASASLGEPTIGNAYALPPDDAMPGNLHEAVTLLRSSPLAEVAFGRGVVEHAATLLDHEWSLFLSQLSPWDTDRYFDRS